MATVANNSGTRQQGRFRRELLPPARTVYEKELGTLTRPDRKGWAKAHCPKHNSKSGKSFSVNVIEGWWHCHGCDIGGDIPGFVQWRYGLTFPAACEYLGAVDRDTSAGHQAEVLAAQRKLEHQRAEQAAKQEADRRRRLNVRDLLHNLENQLGGLAEKCTLELGALREDDWEFLQLLTTAIAETEAEYFELFELPR